MKKHGGKRSGAGRPSKYKGERLVQMSIYLPESVAVQVKGRAETSGMTVSDWLLRKVIPSLSKIRLKVR